jgi:CRISPR-associated protein Csm5
VPQLERELEMLQQLNYANKEWAQGLEKLLANELSEAFKNQQAFLLRVGQHGGAESNTLDGVRHIKIMQGKGNAPKFLAKPTTIWLAANHKDQQHDLLPFGWVLVEIGDFVLDKTHAFLKTQAAPDYQRHEHLQSLATQRAEFLAKEQQKRELQAQQQAEDAEQERLKQAAEDAKTAHMATMTEAQQAIYVLQQEYETAKTRTPEPNGTLRESLSQAIKKSGSWTPAEKRALWEIGNELCTFWGKPKKLKDQLKSLQ